MEQATGELLASGLVGLGVIAEPVPERGVIADPVAVETNPPLAGPREPDRITVLPAVRKVQSDHDVVEGATFRPAVIGDELVGVIDMKHIQAVAPDRLLRNGDRL